MSKRQELDELGGAVASSQEYTTNAVIPTMTAIMIINV